MTQANLFFHGFESSCDTNKFTCITHPTKFCSTVDYQDIEKVMLQYEEMVVKLMSEYDQLLLIGHSLGGYFANYYAVKYNLKSMLIAPCINPSSHLAGRIKDIEELDLPFEYGTNDSVIFIEKHDEALPFSSYNDLIENSPKNYEIFIYKHGHHRICRDGEINVYIDILLDNPLVFVCD